MMSDTNDISHPKKQQHLKLDIVSALIHINTEHVGEMDPYVIVHYS
jgi:hypothetical protein